LPNGLSWQTLLMRKSLQKYFLIFSIAAAGMIAGHLIGRLLGNALPLASAQSADALSTHELEITGSDGRRKILLSTTTGGYPGIWFFDGKGKARMNLGLYEDGNAFVVLNDENELATQIFRTVGTNNAPVLVFKSHGQDRMVFGLNFIDAEPFLVHYDSKGAKTTVFGNY
jgi:hypothetical protein